MNAPTTIIGNLTRDPELRYTTSGRAVASFGVASSKRYKDNATGEWKEQTSFFNVVCWGHLAEPVAEAFRKGLRVVVVGRLEQRRWETPDGDKRSSTEIVADDVGASPMFAKVTVAGIAREQYGDESESAAVGKLAAPAA